MTQRWVYFWVAKRIRKLREAICLTWGESQRLSGTATMEVSDFGSGTINPPPNLLFLLHNRNLLFIPQDSSTRIIPSTKKCIVLGVCDSHTKINNDCELWLLYFFYRIIVITLGKKVNNTFFNIFFNIIFYYWSNFSLKILIEIY